MIGRARKRRCANCGHPIAAGDRAVDMERGDEIETWCGECSDDENQRQAELKGEQARGVYGGEEMGEQAEYEVFQGEDNLWYWHLKAGNGEIVAASEGYASKENAERGVDDAREASAEAQE